VRRQDEQAVVLHADEDEHAPVGRVGRRQRAAVGLLLLELVLERVV
jgi:hypothetical protein